MQERIYQLLVDENEISWKSIIFDLVKSKEMDPWDVDISMLAKWYLEKLNQLKTTDLKLSGKVLLAAALMLRLKSKKLVGEDLSEFDRLLAVSEMSGDQFYDSLEQELSQGEKIAIEGNFELFPRTPQPRQRKVSVYELVKALEKALEVKKRRIMNRLHDGPELVMPEQKFDITSALSSLYSRILGFFKSSKHVSFTELLPSQTKEDKVFTFIPLLHLSNQKKVFLDQKEHFGEIRVNPPEVENADK